jgi:diaminopropionate ammonia-lyase
MAKYMGISATIFVPVLMPEATRAKIRGEGAEIRVVDGNYDGSVIMAKKASEENDMILVMDIGWDGYEEIPEVKYVLPLHNTQLVILIRITIS